MKKIWGIRHARWYILMVRLNIWVAQCRAMGLGWSGANQADIDYLDAVWRGEE